MTGLCGPNDNRLLRKWIKLLVNQFRNFTSNLLHSRQLGGDKCWLCIYIIRGNKFTKRIYYKSHASRSHVKIKTKG